MGTFTAYAGGATSKTVYVRGFTASTGVPYTAGAFNTAGIAASYIRAGAAATTITLATQTAGGAYSSGGFVHLAGGLYRLDVPDAALVAGVDFVEFVVSGISDVAFSMAHVDIMGADPRSANASIADGALTAAKFGSGAITSTVLADNAITAAKINADAITAAKIAADAISEIQSGLATAAALTTVDNEIATLQGTATAIEADTQNIQSRIPAALSDGRILARAQVVGDVLLGEGGVAPGSPIGEIV